MEIDIVEVKHIIQVSYHSSLVQNLVRRVS